MHFCWGLCGAGEVLLENMELQLEAFDYLQLPFAIKQGMSKTLTSLFKAWQQSVPGFCQGFETTGKVKLDTLNIVYHET